MSLNLANINLSRLWEDLCNLVIRPQRAVDYDESAVLGPPLFSLGSKIYFRKELEIENARKMKIKASIYQPIDTHRPAKKLPCVIYCHGNCGSRCDAMDAVRTLLEYNICVLSFDFSGSGKSEGDYVSLGFYEKFDLQAIVQYLRTHFKDKISRIGLWGRSMGAATSIMYSKMDPSISAIVVDSPFTSLEDIMTELVLSHQSWVPKRVIKLGINMLRSSIQTRAGFDIRENCPIEYAKKSYVPVLFAHAEGDDFIRVHHSEKLFEVYAGDKNIIRFDGDHNSTRPDFFYDAVKFFFYNSLISNDPALDTKPVPSGMISYKANIGKPTDKGKKLAMEDSDDDDALEATPPQVTKYTPSPMVDTPIKNALLQNDTVAQLPPSPSTSVQVYLPNSIFKGETAKPSTDIETQELQMAICLSQIDAVKTKLQTTTDEKELASLKKQMEELKKQAKELNLSVE